MNKEYVYKDGKVLVIDENGNQKILDYYDNLDDVLIQENLIETMQNKEQELERKISHLKKNNKFLKIQVWIPFIFALIFSNAFGPMFGINFFDINIWVGLCIPMVVSTAGLASSYCLHSLAQNCIKDQKGTEAELESLRKETKRQKEHLEELRQNKTNNKDIKDKDDFSFSKVNDIKILKALRTYLNFYYDLGYNEKKYLKYYQKGILQEKLGKHYNHSDLISQWAQEYFETKNDKEKMLEDRSVNIIKVKRRK